MAWTSFSRLAVGRDEIEPAPRRQMPGLMRDRRDVGGDRVEPAKIVEQPALDPVGDERRLDGRDVDRRRRDSESILEV